MTLRSVPSASRTHFLLSLRQELFEANLRPVVKLSVMLAARGVLALRQTSYSEQLSVAVRISLPSRSVAPPTRLETRTKESNMYASHWVD